MLLTVVQFESFWELLIIEMRQAFASSHLRAEFTLIRSLKPFLYLDDRAVRPKMLLALVRAEF